MKTLASCVKRITSDASNAVRHQDLQPATGHHEALNHLSLWQVTKTEGEAHSVDGRIDSLLVPNETSREALLNSHGGESVDRTKKILYFPLLGFLLTYLPNAS